MRFQETNLKGAMLIEPDKRVDQRGFFARAWCAREFEEHGLNPRLVQVNVGASTYKGTLRGVHLQSPPHEEAKLVRCTRGAVYDVIVDLRSDSTTHGQWFAAELTADNHKMLYVPEGFGHGYQTLTDGAEICYQTSEFYYPESATGVRYDDPAFGIRWPLSVTAVSDADRNWPPYD